MNTNDKIGQSTISRPVEQEKSSPPQFLVDATTAVNAGQPENAIHILKQAIPQDSFAAYSGIGQIYFSLNEHEKALEWLQRAREDRPDSIMVLADIGRALTGLSRWGEAIEVFREVVEKDPSRTGGMLEFARALKAAGHLRKAEECYKKVLKRNPHVSVLYDLEFICRKTGRMSEAVKYRRKVLKKNPENAEFLWYLGNILVAIEQKQQGIALLRRALEKDPKSPKIHSTLLLVLHFLPNMDLQTLFDEHKQWGGIHAPGHLAGTSHNNDPDPDRRLRIGYVSPNFQRHSVAYFFESLLDGHNPDVTEVYGYGNIKSPDKVTERLKSKFSHYRDISGMDAEEAADLIERDRIDILVDLAGHTRYNSLPAMAYKPAPIQVSYIGYPDTTGMEQIDYRFTDDLADSPQSQKFYTEELVFLPDGFLCYRPPDSAPPLAPLPAEQKGYITFGSFNNNPKINPFIIAIWAEILKANSNSRFMLKFEGGMDQEVRDIYLQSFERFGIARDRIDIHGLKSPFEHLQLYNEMDIALDTYPYNGTTTTCEALWMGVPVISLAGEHHASRVGLSILTRLGLEFFTASTPEGYVAKATALAGKVEELANIRTSMRARMAAGSFCDKDKYAANIEQAYRKMWHRWCQNGAKPA